MTLTKLALARDGKTVVQIAWANPSLHKAGDTESIWSYADVDMNQDAINQLKDPAAAGAVILSGNRLELDTDYVPEPESNNEPQLSAQTQINVQLMKSTAQNAVANAAIMKQLAIMAATDTAKEVK